MAKIKIELVINDNGIGSCKIYNGILISRVPCVGELILIDGYNAHVKNILHCVGEVNEVDASVYCTVCL